MFFPPSPRYLTPQRAADLVRPAGPARVGLFVDPTDALVADTLAVFPLDMLQVVASAKRAVELKARFGLPVWRAVGIRARADLPDSLGGADAVLLDAKPPPGATRPGGNAVSFDWTMLQGWSPPGPWMLAGGLDPGNVAAAITATHAPAVDVSSGVERAPGVKDPALIEAFIHAVRGIAP